MFNTYLIYILYSYYTYVYFKNTGTFTKVNSILALKKKYIPQSIMKLVQIKLSDQMGKNTLEIFLQLS